MTNPSSRDDPFKQLVSILIASITILAGITAFLQTYAANQAAVANRRAQELSLQATTERVSGAIQFSYAWQGAFQTWREIDLQIVNAQQEGDTLAEERFTALRDHIATLSPLLGLPYFDPNLNWPNAASYEADLYIVDATRLTEQFSGYAELGNVWDDIANALVIQLTLLAVTLSMYGLSVTMRGWVRWLFVVVGSGLVLLNLAWMAFLLIAPLPNLPDAAIEAYAQGVGKLYQAKDEEAIDFFDQALAIKPDYANAFYERGNAYYYLDNLANAAADYEAAREAGRDDIHVGWNLGWTYYLSGNFAQAIQINQETLLRDPSLIGLRMNQALVLLASGSFGNAAVEYTLALDEAVHQVSEARTAGKEPPASLWNLMDAGAADLQSLIDTLNGTPKAWTQAPVAGTILADPVQIQGATLVYIRQIKEASVALEYTGQLPGPAGNATLSGMQVGQDMYDDQGNFLRTDIADSFPFGTNEVAILFDYAGMQPGQSQIWKVYRNGFEDPSLRVVADWTLEASGNAVKLISFADSNVFIFSPGDYIVEFYLDYHLLQSVTFTIEE